MTAPDRLCKDCGVPLGGRLTSKRCRACANKARAGTRTQSRSASVAAQAKWAKVRENERLAELARAHGLDSRKAK